MFLPAFQRKSFYLKAISLSTIFFFLTSQIGWAVDYQNLGPAGEDQASELNSRKAEEQVENEEYQKKKLKEQEDLRNQGNIKNKQIRDLQELVNKVGVKQGENVAKELPKKIQQEAQKVQAIQQEHQNKAQEIVQQIAKYGEYYVKFKDKPDYPGAEYHTTWFFNTVPVKDVWNTQILKTGRKFIQHSFGIPDSVSIDDIQSGRWSPLDVEVRGIGEDLPYQGYEFMKALGQTLLLDTTGDNIEDNEGGRRLVEQASVTLNTKHNVSTSSILYGGNYYDLSNGNQLEDRYKSYFQINEDEIGVKTYIQWEKGLYYTEDDEKANSKHVAGELASYVESRKSDQAPWSVTVNEVTDQEYLKRDVTLVNNPANDEEDIDEKGQDGEGHDILLTSYASSETTFYNQKFDPNGRDSYDPSGIPPAIFTTKEWRASYDNLERLKSYDEESVTWGVRRKTHWEAMDYDDINLLKAFRQTTEEAGRFVEQVRTNIEYDETDIYGFGHPSLLLRGYNEVQTVGDFTNRIRFDVLSYNSVGLMTKFRQLTIYEDGWVSEQLREQEYHPGFGLVSHFIDVTTDKFDGDTLVTTNETTYEYNQFGFISELFETIIREGVYTNSDGVRTPYRTETTRHRFDIEYDSRGANIAYKEIIINPDGSTLYIERTDITYDSQRRMTGYDEYSLLTGTATYEVPVIANPLTGEYLRDANGNLVTTTQTVEVFIETFTERRDIEYDNDGIVRGYTDTICENASPDACKIVERSDIEYNRDGTIREYFDTTRFVGTTTDSLGTRRIRTLETLHFFNARYDPRGLLLSFEQILVDAFGVVRYTKRENTIYTIFGGVEEYDQVEIQNEILTMIEYTRALFDLIGRTTRFQEDRRLEDGRLIRKLRENMTYNGLQLVRAYHDTISTFGLGETIADIIESVDWLGYFNAQNQLLQSGERTSEITDTDNFSLITEKSVSDIVYDGFGKEQAKRETTRRRGMGCHPNAIDACDPENALDPNTIDYDLITVKDLFDITYDEFTGGFSTFVEQLWNLDPVGPGTLLNLKVETRRTQTVYHTGDLKLESSRTEEIRSEATPDLLTTVRRFNQTYDSNTQLLTGFTETELLTRRPEGTGPCLTGLVPPCPVTTSDPINALSTQIRSGIFYDAIGQVLGYQDVFQSSGGGTRSVRRQSSVYNLRGQLTDSLETQTFSYATEREEVIHYEDAVYDFYGNIFSFTNTKETYDLSDGRVLTVTDTTERTQTFYNRVSQLDTFVENNSQVGGILNVILDPDGNPITLNIHSTKQRTSTTTNVLNQVTDFTEVNTSDYSSYPAPINSPTPGVTTVAKEITYNSLGQEFTTVDTTTNSWTPDLITVTTRDQMHYNLDNKLFSFVATEQALDDADLGLPVLGDILNSTTTTFRDQTLYNSEGLEEQTVERVRFSGSADLETTQTKINQYFTTNGQIRSYDFISQGDSIPPGLFLTHELVHREIESYTLFDQLYAYTDTTTQFIPPLTSLGALPADIFNVTDSAVPGERVINQVDRTAFNELNHKIYEHGTTVQKSTNFNLIEDATLVIETNSVGQTIGEELTRHTFDMVNSASPGQNFEMIEVSASGSLLTTTGTNTPLFPSTQYNTLGQKTYEAVDRYEIDPLTDLPRALFKFEETFNFDYNLHNQLTQETRRTRSYDSTIAAALDLTEIAVTMDVLYNGFGLQSSKVEIKTGTDTPLSYKMRSVANEYDMFGQLAQVSQTDFNLGLVFDVFGTVSNAVFDPLTPAEALAADPSAALDFQGFDVLTPSGTMSISSITYATLVGTPETGIASVFQSSVLDGTFDYADAAFGPLISGIDFDVAGTNYSVSGITYDASTLQMTGFIIDDGGGPVTVSGMVMNSNADPTEYTHSVLGSITNIQYRDTEDGLEVESYFDGVSTAVNSETSPLPALSFLPGFEVMPVLYHVRDLSTNIIQNEFDQFGRVAVETSFLNELVGPLKIERTRLENTFDPNLGTITATFETVDQLGSIMSGFNITDAVYQFDAFDSSSLDPPGYDAASRVFPAGFTYEDLNDGDPNLTTTYTVSNLQYFSTVLDDSTANLGQISSFDFTSTSGAGTMTINGYDEYGHMTSFSDSLQGGTVTPSDFDPENRIIEYSYSVTGSTYQSVVYDELTDGVLEFTTGAVTTTAVFGAFVTLPGITPSVPLPQWIDAREMTYSQITRDTRGIEISRIDTIVSDKTPLLVTVLTVESQYNDLDQKTFTREIREFNGSRLAYENVRNPVYQSSLNPLERLEVIEFDFDTSDGNTHSVTNVEYDGDGNLFSYTMDGTVDIESITYDGDGFVTSFTEEGTLVSVVGRNDLGEIDDITVGGVNYDVERFASGNIQRITSGSTICEVSPSDNPTLTTCQLEAEIGISASPVTQLQLFENMIIVDTNTVYDALARLSQQTTKELDRSTSLFFREGTTYFINNNIGNVASIQNDNTSYGIEIRYGDISNVTYDMNDPFTVTGFDFNFKDSVTGATVLSGTISNLAYYVSDAPAAPVNTISSFTLVSGGLTYVVSGMEYDTLGSVEEYQYTESNSGTVTVDNLVYNGFRLIQEAQITTTAGTFVIDTSSDAFTDQQDGYNDDLQLFRYLLDGTTTVSVTAGEGVETLSDRGSAERYFLPFPLVYLQNIDSYQNTLFTYGKYGNEQNKYLISNSSDAPAKFEYQDQAIELNTFGDFGRFNTRTHSIGETADFIGVNILSEEPEGTAGRPLSYEYQDSDGNTVTISNVVYLDPSASASAADLRFSSYTFTVGATVITAAATYYSGTGDPARPDGELESVTFSDPSMADILDVTYTQNDAGDIVLPQSFTTVVGGSSTRIIINDYEFDSGHILQFTRIGTGLTFVDSLDVDIDASQTSFDLDPPVAGTFPTDGYLLIDGEFIYCSSRAGDTFSGCTRGALGTTAAPHGAGADVIHLDTTTADNYAPASTTLPAASTTVSVIDPGLGDTSIFVAFGGSAGFPSSGTLIIDGHFVEYSSIIAGFPFDEFVLVNPLTGPEAADIDPGDTVEIGFSDTDTFLSLTSTAGLNPTGGYLILDEGTASEEIVYYTSVVSDGVMIGTDGDDPDGRGLFGTTAADHGPGSIVDTIVGPFDTEITLGSTAGFPASGLIRIGSEVIQYTSISGTTLQGLTRGFLGSTPTFHLSSEDVIVLDNSVGGASERPGIPFARKMNTAPFQLPGLTDVKSELDLTTVDVQRFFYDVQVRKSGDIMITTFDEAAPLKRTAVTSDFTYDNMESVFKQVQDTHDTGFNFASFSGSASIDLDTIQKDAFGRPTYFEYDEVIGAGALTIRHIISNIQYDATTGDVVSFDETYEFKLSPENRAEFTVSLSNIGTDPASGLTTGFDFSYTVTVIGADPGVYDYSGTLTDITYSGSTTIASYDFSIAESGLGTSTTGTVTDVEYDELGNIIQYILSPAPAASPLLSDQGGVPGDGIYTTGVSGLALDEFLRAQTFSYSLPNDLNCQLCQIDDSFFDPGSMSLFTASNFVYDSSNFIESFDLFDGVTTTSYSVSTDTADDNTIRSNLGIPMVKYQYVGGTLELPAMARMALPQTLDVIDTVETRIFFQKEGLNIADRKTETTTEAGSEDLITYRQLVKELNNLGQVDRSLETIHEFAPSDFGTASDLSYKNLAYSGAGLLSTFYVNTATDFLFGSTSYFNNLLSGVSTTFGTFGGSSEQISYSLFYEPIGIIDAIGFGSSFFEFASFSFFSTFSFTLDLASSLSRITPAVFSVLEADEAEDKVDTITTKETEYVYNISGQVVATRVETIKEETEGSLVEIEFTVFVFNDLGQIVQTQVEKVVKALNDQGEGSRVRLVQDLASVVGFDSILFGLNSSNVTVSGVLDLESRFALGSAIRGVQNEIETHLELELHDRRFNQRFAFESYGEGSLYERFPYEPGYLKGEVGYGILAAPELLTAVTYLPGLVSVLEPLPEERTFTVTTFSYDVYGRTVEQVAVKTSTADDVIETSITKFDYDLLGRVRRQVETILRQTLPENYGISRSQIMAAASTYGAAIVDMIRTGNVVLLGAGDLVLMPKSQFAFLAKPGMYQSMLQASAGLNFQIRSSLCMVVMRRSRLGVTFAP